jgi:hypothetical protein
VSPSPFLIDLTCSGSALSFKRARMMLFCVRSRVDECSVYAFLLVVKFTRSRKNKLLKL